MSDDSALLDAIGLHADISQDFVSIHMDGDHDAEVIISGPEDGGEIHDGPVYRFDVHGDQSGVWTSAAFYVPADDLESVSTMPNPRPIHLAAAVALAWVALLAVVGWPVPEAAASDAVVEVAG